MRVHRVRCKKFSIQISNLDQVFHYLRALGRIENHLLANMTLCRLRIDLIVSKLQQGNKIRKMNKANK